MALVKNFFHGLNEYISGRSFAFTWVIPGNTNQNKPCCKEMHHIQAGLEQIEFCGGYGICIFPLFDKEDRKNRKTWIPRLCRNCSGEFVNVCLDPRFIGYNNRDNIAGLLTDLVRLQPGLCSGKKRVVLLTVSDHFSAVSGLTTGTQGFGFEFTKGIITPAVTVGELLKGFLALLGISDDVPTAILGNHCVAKTAGAHAALQDMLNAMSPRPTLMYAPIKPVVSTLCGNLTAFYRAYALPGSYDDFLVGGRVAHPLGVEPLRAFQRSMQMAGDNDFTELLHYLNVQCDLVRGEYQGALDALTRKVDEELTVESEKMAGNAEGEAAIAATRKNAHEVLEELLQRTSRGPVMEIVTNQEGNRMRTLSINLLRSSRGAPGPVRPNELAVDEQLSKVLGGSIPDALRHVRELSQQYADEDAFSIASGEGPAARSEEMTRLICDAKRRFFTEWLNHRDDAIGEAERIRVSAALYQKWGDTALRVEVADVVWELLAAIGSEALLRELGCSVVQAPEDTV
jgi:hypothetical protein